MNGDEQAAVLLFGGRIVHRFEGHRVEGNRQYPLVACGKPLPFRTDSFGYPVYHRWRSWIVRADSMPDRSRLCPTCWPAPTEPPADV